MLTVLLVLQVIITVALIGVILIQRNSGEGLAGLAGGGNSLISGRASANILTRITAVLAVAFMANSLIMAAITSRSYSSDKSIVDDMNLERPAPPLSGVETPAAPGNTQESPTGSKPSVPISE